MALRLVAIIAAKCVLKGKAQEHIQLCRFLNVWTITVKNAILKAYELVPEAYRQTEIIVNKKVKLMLNLPIRKKCTLTDGVTLRK